MTKLCQLFIDEEPYQFQVEGDFFWGEDKLLYNDDDNVISKMPWKHDGFAVVNIFEDMEFQKLKKSIEKNIITALRMQQIVFEEDDFSLENYHKFVKTDEQHNKVIDVTRNLENKNFDFDINIITERLEVILGYKLTSWIEELKKTHLQIRISRPNSLDINPPHRDGYLTYWHDIINGWMPIAGCNEKSSLPVFPGSHLIYENNILRTESKGAKINGNLYYVPCILEIKKEPIKMIRPNPKQGDILIFTPFLIHGAGVNLNKDITRVALELRFPRQKTKF